jgi:plasmid rolling circle replication initiator protein Rep
MSKEGESGKLDVCPETYHNKSDRINNCLNLWVWDRYEKNKILDLKTVNRCSNNRFCPNCRLLDISKFIHKFKDILADYLGKGYSAYMLTLTVPNCKADELEPTLRKLSKCFLSLMRRYKETSKSDHSINIAGGVRVLEITHNSTNDTYHPHYHVLVLVKNGVPAYYLDKIYKGRYSTKRQSYNMKSRLDLEISKYWTMIYKGISITKKSSDSFDCNDSFECDFCQLDKKGFYEVFKYTFKDTDVDCYNTFKNLELSLQYKRLRQGFGVLYNVKCEDIDDGQLQELNLNIEEAAESLYIKAMDELYTTYSEYTKISRFNASVDENIEG